MISKYFGTSYKYNRQAILQRQFQEQHLVRKHKPALPSLIL